MLLVQLEKAFSHGVVDLAYHELKRTCCHRKPAIDSQGDDSPERESGRERDRERERACGERLLGAQCHELPRKGEKKQTLMNPDFVLKRSVSRALCVCARARARACVCMCGATLFIDFSTVFSH